MNSTLTQHIDLSSLSTLIDQNVVDYELNFWMNERTVGGVTLYFYNVRGNFMASNGIGRGTTSGDSNTFVEMHSRVPIGVGVRFIEFQIQFTGLAGTYNDTYIDDISLKLVDFTSVPEPWAYSTACAVLLAGFAFWRRSLARFNVKRQGV